jgi:glycosyltransferase involved in cell wall biosynthesis
MLRGNSANALGGQAPGRPTPRGTVTGMGKPLRVTHCPVNTAGIPWANVQALRARGVDAKLVVFNRYRLHPEADVDLARKGGLIRQQGTQWRAFARLAPHTDIFHFYFGLTLVPKLAQFPLLRAMRKPAVMHFLGSDIRGRPPEDLKWARRAGATVVGSYDAIRWIPDAHVIPPGIDLSTIDPAPPVAHEHPIVLHAPSSRSRKGTEQVVAAAEKLGLNLELVEGVDHLAAFERYRAADLVVDQLNAGWYGMFAIEAMALGKPVVAFLHEEATRRTEEAFGVEVPIVHATKETLADVLDELVSNPAELRRIGAASRAYVERVHDLSAVGERLVDLYAGLQ